MIKLYWIAVPEQNRRNCLFRESCSKHVYRTTQKEGLTKGLKSLKFRYKNCRSGYTLISTQDQTLLVTRNNNVILENEISYDLI